MASKSLDLRYAPLKDYLSVCQRAARSEESICFELKDVYKQFFELEIGIMKALGNKLLPDKCLYTSYVRMAGMGCGIDHHKDTWHMGLYLLYLTLFSGHLSCELNLDEIAGGCLTIALRLMNHQYYWSTHLSDISGLFKSSLPAKEVVMAYL